MHQAYDTQRNQSVMNFFAKWKMGWSNFLACVVLASTYMGEMQEHYSILCDKAQ
jgi:hypothetical protein